MAEIICPKCKKTFDSDNVESYVTKGAAAAAGAAAGGWVGSGMGIVGGPFGAVNGWWIGAAVGAFTAYTAFDQFRRCPHEGCGDIFRI